MNPNDPRFPHGYPQYPQNPNTPPPAGPVPFPNYGAPQGYPPPAAPPPYPPASPVAPGYPPQGYAPPAAPQAPQGYPPPAPAAPAAVPSVDDIRRYFAGMRNAQPFGRGRYITPGLARATVDAITIQPSRNPKAPGRVNFTAKCTVQAWIGTEYTNVKGSVVNTKSDFSPGDSFNVWADLADPMYGLANAKEFLAPLGYAMMIDAMNANPAAFPQGLPSLDMFLREFDEDDTISVIGTGAFQGMTIDVRAWHIITKGDPQRNKPPSDFTVKEFKAYPRSLAIPPLTAMPR